MPLTRRSLIAAASVAAMTQGDAHAAPTASGQGSGAKGPPDAALSKIALEEHFITPTLLDYFKTGRPPLGAQVLNTLTRRLSDFGEERLAEMDQAGVAKSILSVSGPGVQIEPDTMTAQKRAKQANDVLAAQIAKRPDRYGGFAHLAMQDPKTAADELERCVHDLGFVGALINGQTNGVYLDDPSNDVFWERMQALELAPISPGHPA
jgi:2,3-dihydroxybenzoate decarboxylase